jgi:hypothetical protein
MFYCSGRILLCSLHSLPLTHASLPNTRPQSRPAKLTHVCSLHSLQLTRANLPNTHTTPRYEMFRMMVQPTDREADNELTRRRAPDEKHVIDIEEEESVLSEQEQVLTMISSLCFMFSCSTHSRCLLSSLASLEEEESVLSEQEQAHSLSLHLLFSHFLSSLLLLSQPSIFTLSTHSLRVPSFLYSHTHSLRVPSFLYSHTHSLRVPSFLYSLKPLSSHSLLYDNRFAKRCTNPT